MAVPSDHRERVMQDAHCTPSSGHLGVEKTYDRVAREYYWKGIYHDVKRFVKECVTCQRYKVSQQGCQGLMGKRIVERPWAVVAADLMEFPPSKSQHKYLVVFQDLFTRWIEVKPLRKADGKSVARAFEELILFRWETPDYLLTDNGREFINKHLQETLKEYGVRHITTPPYHPQANPVERSNRTLKTMIAAFVGNDHRNWDVHVHEFRHAANTAVQASTKVSPAFLNYGRHPKPVKSLRREVEGTRAVEKLPMDVEETAPEPSAAAKTFKPAEEKDKEIMERKEEPVKEITIKETEKKTIVTPLSKEIPKVIPEQRAATPVQALPIDRTRIAPTPTDWDEPATVSKYADKNIAPYSRIEEHKEYRAWHPTKEALKKMRKEHENPNPRRHPTKEDYVPRYLSSPTPTWRRDAAPAASRYDWPASTAPAPSASDWPAPAADWTRPSAAPAGNWRDRPSTSAKDLRGWLDQRPGRATGPRESARIPEFRGDFYERRPREENERRVPTGGPTAPDPCLQGVTRTVTTGTMYCNIREIVTDPRVDPPPHVCFNCWERGHSYTQCPRPQTQNYCRNCGRRHVEVQQCPRCSEAHQKHLDWQREQYREHLIRIGREEMQRRRAELYGSAPWHYDEFEQRDGARPSTSAAHQRAAIEPSDRSSRKRTRDDSPNDRRAKRSSRDESVASSSSRREEGRVLGARHETFRILEETRHMPDHLREGLVRTIVHEFYEKQEEERHRRRH